MDSRIRALLDVCMKNGSSTIIQKLYRGIRTKTADETVKTAVEFASFVPKNTTLALHGDLGAGKTTFIKGLAQAWQISETVTSPTFNLYTIYQGTRQLVHLDAYRLDSGADMDALMIHDFLSEPWCLAIEWPERIAEELPENVWHLYLSIGPDKQHCIRLKT